LSIDALLSTVVNSSDSIYERNSQGPGAVVRSTYQSEWIKIAAQFSHLAPPLNIILLPLQLSSTMGIDVSRQ
jgi:hypothetical protein